MISGMKLKFLNKPLFLTLAKRLICQCVFSSSIYDHKCNTFSCQLRASEAGSLIVQPQACMHMGFCMRLTNVDCSLSPALRYPAYMRVLILPNPIPQCLSALSSKNLLQFVSISVQDKIPCKLVSE